MPQDDGITRSLKDITAGSVGGIAQVLVGQPFDIVKVGSPPELRTSSLRVELTRRIGEIADSGDGVC